MHRWSERDLSGNINDRHVIHSDLCPVCEEYRVYFREWSFSGIDRDTGGNVVSVSAKNKRGSLGNKFSFKISPHDRVEKFISDFELFAISFIQESDDQRFSLYGILNLDKGKHVTQINVERHGQVNDGIQCGIFFASLDTAEIFWADTHFAGQLFLGDALPVSDLGNSGAYHLFCVHFMVPLFSDHVDRK